MTGLLEFISGLLDGFGLLALAVSVGGIPYALLVLRATGPLSPTRKTTADQTLLFISLGAMSLAIIRMVQLILKPWALDDGMGEWALGSFYETQVFQSGLISVLLAGGLALAVLWVRRDMAASMRWTIVVLTTWLFLVNEAWLSHGASRIENSGPLMAVTIVHLLGAVTWAGGIIHLLLFWWRTRQRPEFSSFWPEAVARFSPIGIVSVALIIVPGLYLAWSYVGGWEGMVGTGYGNMLIVKFAFFSFVLILAFSNFFAARVWQRTREALKLYGRVPAYIEVELILAVALLFTAAALTSFPPAVDVQKDMATPAEMWSMFNPKVPRLAGPELILVEAPENTDLQTGQIGWKEDMSWDRFNHNISGVIVLAIAVIALLDRLAGISWARHWPLMFIAFSVLIVVFANPDDWPLGHKGFIESLQNTEVVQHWLAGLVVFGLGLFEWRTRCGSMDSAKLRFVFPLLCIVGGIILLTHSHEIFALKREFLIQSTHVLMGLLGVIVGCSRWLELRLPPPQDRLAGFVSIAGIMLVGFVLLFYITPGVRNT